MAGVMIFIEQFRVRWPWSIGVSPQPGTKRRGEGILRMEDAGSSEEDDDIDSQDSNTLIDHGHLVRNCSMKISSAPVFKLGLEELILDALFSLAAILGFLGCVKII